MRSERKTAQRLSAEKDLWKWETGFAIAFGIPIYLGLPLAKSWWVHLTLIACYAGLLLLFGRRSAIELGVNMLVIAAFTGILYPLYTKTIRLNHERASKQKQKSSRPLSEGVSNVERKKS